LKTKKELEKHTENYIEKIKRAATAATPELRVKGKPTEIAYSSEIKEHIKKRRRARRIWHTTRNPVDKNTFNNISNKVNRLIKNFKLEGFKKCYS